MGVSQYSRDLERIRARRVNAEKKVGEYRRLESKKRAEADKAGSAAVKATSEAMRRAKLNEQSRRLTDARNAGKKAAEWQKTVESYSKRESSVARQLAKAQQGEAVKKEKKRQREYQEEMRRLRAMRASLDSRLADTERNVENIMRDFPKPKKEKLRVLVLATNPHGDLRSDKEQRRIEQAVRKSTHRDWIEMHYIPAATLEDLFDGIAEYSPHVLHFSGHSNGSCILLEQDIDKDNDGFPLFAGTLKQTLVSTDNPPLVVVLNSCKSAKQLNDLVGVEIPFAVGMLDSVGDLDAIAFSARFYANIANGQSLKSAVESAKAYLSALGSLDADLPFLRCAADADPRELILVQAPNINVID